MPKVLQITFWPVIAMFAFMSMSIPGVSHAQSKAEAEAAAPPKPKTPPPIGQCASPHNSVYTLLVYLQNDNKYNPGRASACISREGLGKPAEAPRLAIKLKKILDARGLYVVLDDLPNVADHTDDKGRSQYVLFPKSLPEMTY